ncbi:hypothetical protein [Pedobacter boryungensis]|uniref:MetA-pathway of phenol degradation n=1 Tax=Pedobacter boryungensis TaxID=869962 RepID=A0ABX2DEA9_9SPHI|nr:hypothetical protein [Pedobacter boryungensis]NQX31459.1 hypothetical protein [Pedobacter boryungensis]
MIKKIIAFALIIIGANQMVNAQELYVYTEPASNMPSKSIGIRLANEGFFSPDFRSRSVGEMMIGLNKNLMFHAQGFVSDMDGKYRLEGGSFYAKYRFLSIDETQSHFRGAAYGRISTSKRPTYTEDINLEGDNSGWQAGLIFTQLIHKLALSATFGYSEAFESKNKQLAGMPEPDKMLNYSLSSGYLVLPFVYKNYNQPNFNVYLELLGKTNPANGNSYLDLAPALQLILNSRTRIDLGYRFQVAGDIQNRYLKNMYLAKVEFNFFNVLK